jgi:hypothetical protein
MLAFPRRVLHAQDHDFIGELIEHVIDEIGIFARHDLGHSLGLLQPANVREQDQVLQSVVNCSANPPRMDYARGDSRRHEQRSQPRGA